MKKIARELVKLAKELEAVHSEEVLEEVGVHYTFHKKTAEENHYRAFEFVWKHITGKSGKIVVYCFNEKDFLKLLNRWNNGSDQWSYSR